MRATGYINKVSDAWSVHVSSLANVRLFLVARPGPSVFVLKDEEDNTIKTTLGNPHRCSCGVTACVHLAFCIIKVLKVPKEHPLSHQTSLTDNELDLLLSGTLARHTQARAVARSLHPQEPNSPPKPKADAGTVPRQALSEVEEENTCTICQDDMKSDQPLTWCRHGCGNNFHAQCMMKFAGHKISNKQDPSCPLCR
ncbi:RING finger domain-containing protein [archaeon]|nr:MAG: RING finger domain-containing protein [archaeon]